MRVSGSETLVIEAGAEACRTAVIDLSAYADWYPGVRRAELVEADGGCAKAGLLFRTGLPVLAEIECVLALEAVGTDRLQPTTDGGALRIDGPGWTFTPEPDGRTRVTLDIGVEMSVPGGFVTERLVKGKARHFLIEEPVAALKRHVERA